jgi:tetratricopeptide (TPR) repeat protein
VIFGWRKDESAGAAFEPQPEKARKFFEHAKTVGEADQLEYSLQLWANGLKLDPTNMAAHEAMYQVACKFHGAGGTPASGKELREVDGPGPVDKMVAAEYAWMRDLNNATLVMKFLQQAGKAQQFAVGQWIAPKAMNIMRGVMKAKPQKKTWLQAMEIFETAQAFDEAYACGEEAQRLDPSDGNLEHTMRQLTAARAIKQGGYERTFGQVGGFRNQVRDAERQRQLEAANSISGAGGGTDTALDRARQEYEGNPSSPDAINKYATSLRKRGQGDDEQKAIEVYMAGYEAIKEYRFKMGADDLRIARARRAERAAKDQLSQAPDNAQLQGAADVARAALLELEGAVFRERVAKYPTNREFKADLGRIEYELGRYEDAMAAFQAAKDDPKLRVNSAWMLGRCFAKEGWHTEAASEYKEALASIDSTHADKELEIRYDLMLALMELARAEKSSAHAKEAAEICSAIIRKNIGFKDVRARRKEVDELVRTLG